MLVYLEKKKLAFLNSPFRPRRTLFSSKKIANIDKVSNFPLRGISRCATGEGPKKSNQCVNCLSAFKPCDQVNIEVSLQSHTDVYWRKLLSAAAFRTNLALCRHRGSVRNRLVRNHCLIIFLHYLAWLNLA